MRRIVTAIDGLAEFPDRGRSVGAGKRELIVRFGKSGYVVLYLHLSEQKKVVVMRIWHGLENRS